MIRGEIGSLELYDALHLCEFTRTTGAVLVSGSGRSGAIWLHDGAVSFAETDGGGDRGLNRAGIAPEPWAIARSSGRAGSALIDGGVSAVELRSFVKERIEVAVAELASIPGPRIEVTGDPGWFGHDIVFAVPVVIEAARIINFGGELIGDTSPDTLIALCPSTAPVTVSAEQWNVIAEMIGTIELATLRRMVGNRPAIEFVRFLQGRSLASTVMAMPTLD
ncbi:MAG: DUF4388 domain-containing protein [Acidimicrobiia bacterium]